MTRAIHRRTAVVFLALLGATALLAGVVVGVGTALTADATLVVEHADGGDRVLEVPVDEGTEVTVSYMHSVEKTPVEDIYVVDDGALRMDRMVFVSHGAGLPSDADIEETDDGFVVYPDGTYERLNVVPGEIAGHELIVGDERYDLVERTDGPVVLSVADRSLTDAVPWPGSSANAPPGEATVTTDTGGDSGVLETAGARATIPLAEPLSILAPTLDPVTVEP
ncbi:hypothetical protein CHINAEXTREME_05615 [Halobiforma lacisalsi AJ5]|uniref:DUF1850 domain-containing protein n=1 Tax=Natronobacterium lacisalsi AJ5 TaxID=358396 RepID=M0LJI1_NATLA|nr:DUF1850 domain-containing protein [Halobiforma lacisalsi]APW97281.1 hypothetical protein CHINAEXTREME_05615 [Halobiforma lacisalsi AJ5]EMA33792.1 hypothetical protein C445_08889 [Halobiforma lacisalsi AJ5]